MTGPIYIPRGRAREYAALAVSLYWGCPHRCRYCYVPESLRISPDKTETWYNVRPRPNVIPQLEKEFRKMKDQNDQTEILMSFTCDPFNAAEEKYRLTWQALELAVKYDVHVTTLTKATPEMGYMDFMAEHSDLFRYGASLTFSNERDRAIWEPEAAPIWDRVDALDYAYDQGLRTWVSLEPTPYPEQSLELIRRTHEIVDQYKIGKFNHARNPQVKAFIQSINYRYPTDEEYTRFCHAAKELLDREGCEYVFKDDLLPYLSKEAERK